MNSMGESVCAARERVPRDRLTQGKVQFCPTVWDREFLNHRPLRTGTNSSPVPGGPCVASWALSSKQNAQGMALGTRSRKSARALESFAFLSGIHVEQAGWHSKHEQDV